MLANIQSIYFIRLLFSQVNEKRKLKLVKYNKSFQNLLDIKLINYKFFTGRYIVYGTKTKGKEYLGYKELLVYKGEFKNGEKNGKGKEYDDNGKLKYEGEYQKGSRNGKGKEYSNHKLIFEGEYLNGKIWNGKSKRYSFFRYFNI